MRRRALALAAVTLAACAAGPPLLRGQPIRKSVAVLVRVSDKAAADDQLGGTAALVDAVSEGLRERGVMNEVFAADDDHPPAPRIELWVQEWDGGAPGERALPSLLGGVVGAMASAGRYVVVFRVYREGDVKPAVEGSYSDSISGYSDEESADEARRVAARILEKAFASD